MVADASVGDPHNVPAENEAANGPLTMYDTSDIAFEPSGNAPYIELGAPAYDKGLADRRRT